MKVSAVFFANGLGDHLLTLPSLRALARILPTRLALITAEGPSEFLFRDVGIDRFVKVPMERPGLGAARSFSASEVTRRLGPIECLISLVPWHSPSLSELVRLVRPAWSIGLHHDFDFCVRGDAHEHSADRPFKIVKKFAPDLQLSDFADPFALPPQSVAAAEDVRRAIGVNRRLLVVHEETATKAKRWLPSRMQQTLRVLTAEYPDLFAIVVSRDPPSFQIETLGEAAIAITRIALPFFLALIAQADIFIGVDSVGLHAADLWGIPAIGLFGPTRPQEWGFRFSGKGVHVDGRGSMRNISVEQVVSAFSSLLTEGTGHHL
jgi:Glycosyltransferase family 9 (heptosyltransferase)